MYRLLRLTHEGAEDFQLVLRHHPRSGFVAEWGAQGALLHSYRVDREDMERLLAKLRAAPPYLPGISTWVEVDRAPHELRSLSWTFSHVLGDSGVEPVIRFIQDEPSGPKAQFFGTKQLACLLKFLERSLAEVDTGATPVFGL